MSLEIRHHQQTDELDYGADPEGTPDSGPREGCNVLVTSGIHRGRFPIGGLTVGDARGVLQRLVNVDEGAVAVINGRAVDDDEVIGPEVTHVAFVKPSAIKGRS